MEMSKRILVYRAKNNLTQKEMGELLNLNREWVNRLENGKVKPTKFTLMKMELLEKGE